MAKFFSDDFEDATDFDGTSADAGCTVTTDETANPKNGSKHLRVTITATANDFAYAYEDSSGDISDEVWLQAWVYFHDLPDSDGEQYRILFAGVGAGASVNCYAGIYNDGGTVKWFVRYRDSASFANSLSAGASPVADTWYQVRFGIKAASGTGFAKLYVDDTTHVEETGLTNDDRALNYPQVGAIYSTGPTGGTSIDFDDVDIATSDGDLSWAGYGKTINESSGFSEFNETPSADITAINEAS